MKKLITLLVLMLSISTFANIYTFAFSDPGDKNGTITGTVIDKNLQQPIPYVSIVIKNLEGEIITGGITDDNGVFVIEDIPDGKSIVSIQYIGYKTHTREIEISRKNKKIDLGRIELEEDIEALDEVVEDFYLLLFL